MPSKLERLSLLWENCPDALLLAEADTGRVVDANPQAERLFGLSRGDLCLMHQSQLHPAEHCNAVRIDFSIAANGSQSRFVNDFILRRDGTQVPVEIRSSVIEMEGRVHVLGSFRDITERREAEEKLLKSDEHLRLAQDAGHVGVWEWDLIGDCSYWSPEARRLYGVEDETELASNEGWRRRIHPNDLPIIDAAWKKIEDGESFEVEFRICLDNGAIRWLVTKGKADYDPTGKPMKLIGVNLDITERKQAEERIRDSEARFRHAMEAANHGLWDWDITSDEAYFSPYYFLMLGYEPEELPMTAQTWVSLIHPDDRQRTLAATQDCIENRCEQIDVEFRMKAKDGSWRWILGRGRAFLRNLDGRAVRIMGTNVDITKAKEMEEKLQELARTDPLTALANRRSIIEAIETEFLRSKRFGSDTAVLMIDIDHFKRINDTHGHEAGDRALVALARSLKTIARVTDLVARFGGEEFVVLLVGTDLSGAVDMAERIREAVAQIVLTSPSGDFRLTVSIGVAPLLNEDDEWSDTMSRADRAMYRAKNLGRNRVVASGPLNLDDLVGTEENLGLGI